MLDWMSQIFGILGVLPSQYQKTSLVLSILSAFFGYFAMEHPVNIVVIVFSISLTGLVFIEGLSDEFRGAVLAIWAFVILSYFASVLTGLVPDFIWCGNNEGSAEVCLNRHIGKWMARGQ
ncbi:hypothetical protein [Methylobacterium sp. Leaf123]|uniref:hypothetical protein n=1 Tax=Methylobacterium sp. Leaf123 TaxID=1736264 RepID=UPI0012E858E1|nr:hypothetical protein [Methylobacterium sp. Leaf123]